MSNIEYFATFVTRDKPPDFEEHYWRPYFIWDLGNATDDFKEGSGQYIEKCVCHPGREGRLLYLDSDNQVYHRMD